MGDIVKIEVRGRLGKAPEVKSLPDGKQFVQFSVASSKRVHDKVTGEWKNTDPTWFSVSCWNKTLADMAMKLEAGQEVTVWGNFKARPYTRKDNGQNVLSLDIDAKDIDAGYKAKAKPHADVSPEIAPSASNEFSDDIPF